jgi:hypothetical protein
MKQFLNSSNLLQTIVAESEKNSEAARTLTSDLSEAQLNWKPSPEQWSIAQCLEHLAITSGKFDNYFSAALERARKKRPITDAPAYKPSMVGGWLARQVNPDGGRNLPAPKVFRPSEASNIHTPFDLFLDQQVKFIEFVRQCEGIDYNKTRLRSPVTPLMRYSLADAFVITVLHAQRHLGQARRVREMPQFPRS